MAKVSEEIKSAMHPGDRVYVGADRGDLTGVISVYAGRDRSENIAILTLKEMRAVRDAMNDAINAMER